MEWPNENGSKVAERVAADVGRDVHRPDVLLRQLERREHRALRAADAEARRARGQRRRRAARRRGAARLVALQPGACRLGHGLRGRVLQVAADELGQAVGHAPRRCTRPPSGSMSLPCSGVWMSRRRSSVAISCSMYSGWPSSTTSTARLPSAEVRELLGHQRVGDVEHQHGNVGVAEGIGQAELLQRADERCCTDRPAR